MGKTHIFGGSLAVLAVSVMMLLASCKDDKTDVGPVSPITGLKIPDSSPENPFIEGALVTVEGEGFTFSSQLWVLPATGDGSALTVTAYSDRSVSFRIPPFDGTYKLKLTQEGNEFLLGTMTFISRKNWVLSRHIQLPKSSASAPLIEGDTVRISGSGFVADSQIWLSESDGGEAVQAELVDWSDKELSFVAPAFSGEMGVTLRTIGHDFALGQAFFELKRDVLVGKWICVGTEWLEPERGIAYVLDGNLDYTYDKSGDTVRITLFQYGEKCREYYTGHSSPDFPMPESFLYKKYQGGNALPGLMFRFDDAGFTLNYAYTGSDSENSYYEKQFENAPYAYDSETGTMAVTLGDGILSCEVEKIALDDMVFVIADYYYPLPMMLDFNPSPGVEGPHRIHATTRYTLKRGQKGDWEGR